MYYFLLLLLFLFKILKKIKEHIFKIWYTRFVPYIEKAFCSTYLLLLLYFCQNLRNNRRQITFMLCFKFYKWYLFWNFSEKSKFVFLKWKGKTLFTNATHTTWHRLNGHKICLDRKDFFRHIPITLFYVTGKNLLLSWRAYVNK